jgi:glucose/arabinose dehydrogenase
MKRRSLVPAAVSLAIVGCGGGGSIPTPNPPPPPPPPCHTGLETPRAFANLSFSSPTAMLQSPNDASRWFVVEQGGVVRTFPNDPDATESAEFIDLSSRVHMQGEAGLLGMAFHPSFSTNGLVYLNFTEEVGGELRSVTAEFESTDGGQTLDPATERDLLTVEKPATNHNGGNLAFGADGFLYVGLGDGGNSDTAQDTRRLLGKFLRIDVDSRPFGAPYGIPPNNPFVGAPLCNFGGTGVLDCPEIYAIGFRNPWRWSFDGLSGSLWVGDVGQSSFEEIDIVERGGNYGWDVREGAHCFPPSTGCSTDGLTDPVAEYGRDLGFSITGGYVYRGGQQTQVAGNYVFGDFGGMIAWLEPDTLGGYTVRQLVEEGCTPPGADGALAPSAFAQDLDGELFLLDYGTGQIRSLVFTE